MPGQTVKLLIIERNGVTVGEHEKKPKHFYIGNFFKISCTSLAHPYKNGDLISNY